MCLSIFEYFKNTCSFLFAILPFKTNSTMYKKKHSSTVCNMRKCVFNVYVLVISCVTITPCNYHVIFSAAHSFNPWPRLLIHDQGCLNHLTDTSSSLA